jgi:hypothetical protein
MARLAYEYPVKQFQILDDFARKQRPDLRRQLLRLWESMNREQRQAVLPDLQPDALGI